MNPRRLLRKLADGSFSNVKFTDAQRLATALGFRLERRQSSHHIYTHPALREQLNLQEVDGEAKPYQLRQMLRLAERYNLKLEETP